MKQPASILIVTLMLIGAGHVCRAQQEPAHRGTHLYQPPGVRVHDPWLVNVDGTVHLFHLPDAWHATSRDCVFWEPHRAILANSAFTAAERNYNTEPEVWTGCAVHHEGKIYLFWTGNKGVNRRLCNRTCLSISSDGGKTFTHHPDNPAIQPDPRWYDTENDPAPEYPYHGKTHNWSGGVDGKMALMDWRDIAIVKDPKTGLFHGYIVARLRGKKNDKESACIARVSSKDLVHWEVHPPAFHPGTWGLHEVPDVFQLGGKWYLTAMATNPREGVYHGDDPLLRWGHVVGESDTPEGPFRLVKDNCVMAGVDQAKGDYSMRTVEFKGERLAFACGDKLSLAVKLVPREGGGLQDVWWPANEKLFGEKRGLALRDVPGQPTIEAPPRGDDSFMILAGIELGTASAAGITFRKADGGQPRTLFLDSTKGCFEWVGGDIPGTGRIAARTWPIKPGGKHTIRVINIEQHIVVYLDDRYVMNGRGLKFETAGLALTSVGGKARLRDIQYWGPKNGMPNPLPVDVRAARAGFRPAMARLSLDRSQVTPGGTVQATYTFRSSGASQSEMTVFVHVVRPDGRHIGADFEPDLPTSKWPQDGFVCEGPFPIVVPEDAAPGKYQVWAGMFPPGGGDRIQFENAEQQRGPREYHVGEFDVVAAGFTVAPKPAVFNWLAVDETKIVQSPAMATSARSNLLQRLTLSVDRKVLNPVRDPAASAKLILTGIYRDGSQRVLEPSEAVIKVRTKAASGNVEVVAIEGDKVVPKEGGIATIEATVAGGGKTFHACTDVVVAPFYRDYHQTLVLKLFLGMEGEPVERLAKEPLFQKPHDVLCTFGEALEVIRKTDNLTRGIPKIIYLVGWQKGGHDHGYPAWDEVNPRMKRKQDATALESLRWLIREARKFNTTVSLHINMADAYKQSPLWDEYLAKDCIAKDEIGQPYTLGLAMKGEDMYNVVYPKEWEAGLAQRRIDGLIKMIPELKEGHTIHIDVFIAQRDGGKPISPWHAKPENGGLTPEKYVETQRKIFHYWRDRGFDVTGEGIFWAHPPGEGFTGLQAMSWWYPSDFNYQMQIPECLMARGRTDRGGDGDFRFGSSMHGEEIWNNDKTNMPGFLGMFCRTTLPWYYLSRQERQKFENDVLYYSDGVVARTEGGKSIIRKGDFVLRENNNLFVPALWNKQEIIAYSGPGYNNKSWQLPDDWRDVKGVDLYRITLEGCVPLKKSVPVADGKLVLSLGKDEAVSVVPAGADLSGKKVLCAEAGPPADQRRTGYVHDTSINPFIVTGEGKELGDPMPVYWDGVWHLYALSADFRMVPHFTSTDMVKWVEHKPAMVGKDICTGTVVRHENKYYLFYTDAGPQTIRLVVSDNPWEFDFNKSRLVAEADGSTYRKSTGFFRDPYVFYNEEENLWWMLIEGRCPEVCAGLLKSKDLFQWTRCEPIFKDKARTFGSCPQIFKQGQLWYLACQDWYNWHYTAENPYGPWTNRGPYLSVAIEAASRFATDGKRQITWGWLANFEQINKTPGPANVYPPTMRLLNYGGPLCIGREMVFKKDGTMGVRPFPELLAAIRKTESKTDLFACARKLSGEWKVDAARRTLQCTGESGGIVLLDLPEKNPNCYFEAELEFDSPRTSASIVLRSSDKADRGYGFALSPAEKKIAIRGFNYRSDGKVLNDKEYAYPGKNKVSLQIFICDNNMEVFVDGQECLSARTIDRTCHKVAIEVAGGAATVSKPLLHYFKNRKETP